MLEEVPSPANGIPSPAKGWKHEISRLNSTRQTESERKSEDESPCASAPRKCADQLGGVLQISGPAAVAISCSNEVTAKRRTSRTFRPKKNFNFRRGLKKATRRTKPPKGKVIDGRHEQYTITYAMQLGIQRSVEYAHTALPDSFESACGETITTKFPPEGSESTPEHAMKHQFSVKDYAPCVFSRIRALMGVQPEVYLESLCSGLDYIDFISNSRSGQFFFYSFDGVFMIKTVRKDEKDFLIKLLPGYYRHLRKHSLGADSSSDRRAANSVDSFFPNNNSTLLTRFYGLHCARLRHLRHKVHFVVMSSVFGANTSSRMLQFDLKGSSHLREASTEDRVLKDNDAKRRGLKLRVGPERARALLKSCHDDSYFLAHNGVMDYSLLVGIYGSAEIQRDKQRTAAARGAPRSNNDGGQEAGASAVGDLERDDTLEDVAFQSEFESAVDVSSEDGKELSEFNSRHFSRRPFAQPRQSWSTNDDDLALIAIREEETALTHAPSSAAAHANANRPVTPNSSENTSPNLASASVAPFDVAIAGQSATGETELYYLGIIDILQIYNLRKHVETDLNKLKDGIFSAKYKTRSCVAPKMYRDRFIKFLKGIFE